LPCSASFIASTNIQSFNLYLCDRRSAYKFKTFYKLCEIELREWVCEYACSGSGAYEDSGD